MGLIKLIKNKKENKKEFKKEFSDGRGVKDE
jgi:hypothetical protein